MIYFFSENVGAILSLLVMATFWFLFNFRSVKGNIQIIDKMRIAKGMIPLNNDEVTIMSKVLRSSVINDSIGPLIGGIVALIVVYFIN